MVSSPSRGPGFVSGRSLLQIGAAVLTAALVPALTGCHPAVTDPNDPKFIVAEKADWKITRGELDTEVGDYLKQHQQTAEQIGPAKMPILQTAMLDNMVLKKLILAQAATLPLKDVDKEEADALEQLKGRYPSEAEFEAALKAAGLTVDELKKRIHEDTLIRKTLEIQAFKNQPPSEQEIDAFYMANKDKFTIPDKIRASRVVIMFDDKTSPADKAGKKKAIDAAHARVVKGEDFGKVASEVSEDRYSAPKGGDIGFFQRGENEANFDDIAFSTKTGQVSPVFETPMGYEFIKVTDVHPGGQVSVAEARDIIAKYLMQMEQEKEEEDYTKDLLKNSGVTYHLVRVNLPETPGGAPGDADSGGQPAGGAPADATNPGTPGGAPADANTAPAPGQ